MNNESGQIVYIDKQPKDRKFRCRWIKEEAMLKKSLIIVGIIAAISLVSACSGTDTLLQKNWGKSYETAAYNQTLNPDADKTLKPVDSLDGQAAENNLQGYRNGFKAKKQNQTTLNFNLK